MEVVTDFVEPRLQRVVRLLSFEQVMATLVADRLADLHQSLQAKAKRWHGFDW
jgi:hypothetical protein